MTNAPKFTTLQSILQYYISIYYLYRERETNIKQEPVKHIQLIERIERRYQKELLKYPGYATEENRQQFRKEIDFLTQVFSKIKKEEERKEALNKFKNSLQRKPVTGI